MKAIKIKDNNILKGEFKLYVEDQKQDNYSGYREITIGKEEYLPFFDEKIVNRKIKKTLEVKFSFAKDYPIEEFRRKSALIIIDNIEIIEQENFKGNESENLAKIKELEHKLSLKENEIKVLEYTFKEKASELSNKANEQIAQFRKELEEKNKNELAQAKKFALLKFIEDFETPFNNFKMAVQAGENSDNIQVKNYCYGFNIVSQQFEQVLNDHGVSLILPQVGQEFDAHKEQAIDFSTLTDFENNIITKVVKPGIMIEDRVIKPASVVVNKK